MLYACVVSLYGEQGGLTFRVNGRYVQSVVGQSVLLLFLSWSVLQLVGLHSHIKLPDCLTLSGFIRYRVMVS